MEEQTPYVQVQHTPVRRTEAMLDLDNKWPQTSIETTLLDLKICESLEPLDILTKSQKMKELIKEQKPHPTRITKESTPIPIIIPTTDI